MYQEPDTGRFISRIFRGEDDPRGAATVLIQQREDNKKIIELGREIEIKLNRLQAIVDQMIEQHLICTGYIHRCGRWQLTSRLHHSLTPDERNLIRRIKAKVSMTINDHKEKSRFTQDFNSLSNNSPKANASLDREAGEPANRMSRLSEANREIPNDTSKLKMTNHKEQLQELSEVYMLDDEQLATVRQLLNVEPSLWREFGDINNWTRERALRTDERTLQHECVRKGLEELRSKLLSDGSSPLEVIAIEQIITCHIQLARSGAELEDINPCNELAHMSNHWSKVHNQAQTRLFRAINTLQRLRRTNLQTIVYKHKHRHIDFNSQKLNAVQSLHRDTSLAREVGEARTGRVESQTDHRNSQHEDRHDFENFESSGSNHDGDNVSSPTNGAKLPGGPSRESSSLRRGSCEAARVSDLQEMKSPNFEDNPGLNLPHSAERAAKQPKGETGRRLNRREQNPRNEDEKDTEENRHENENFESSDSIIDGHSPESFLESTTSKPHGPEYFLNLPNHSEPSENFSAKSAPQTSHKRRRNRRRNKSNINNAKS